MTKLSKLFLAVVVLVLFGLGLPRLVPALPASAATPAKTFGLHALREARTLLNNPLQRVLIQRLNVSSITKEVESGECGEIPYRVAGGYTAQVEARTFFALPFVRVQVTCEGAYIRQI